MPRTIQPELLDTLSPQHPDAVHSRRDLRIINRILGLHRWLEESLRSRLRPGERVLEIGAGTGELAVRLNRNGIPTDGLDFVEAPDGWPSERNWHAKDLREFDGYSDYSVVVGNLVFHHLTDQELTELGARLRRSSRLIIACEPARQKFAQFLFRILGPLFGASHVTLHDGHVSIAGGFCQDELPDVLGLNRDEWAIECSAELFGGYRMIATRRA
jgi:2-polyprenyl-3-methyl-5-hydroxy-6-metoxy-1,4-benzoquinol methylase